DLVRFRSVPLPDAFDDGAVGHPAALAHALQSVASTGPNQLVDEGGQEAGTGGAERVAQGDSPAVDVGPLPQAVGIAATVLHAPRADHRGERLVDLEQVDVVDGEAGALQHLRGGGNGPGEHGDGVDTGERE